jgi:hypothetical protein
VSPNTLTRLHNIQRRVPSHKPWRISLIERPRNIARQKKKRAKINQFVETYNPSQVLEVIDEMNKKYGNKPEDWYKSDEGKKVIDKLWQSTMEHIRVGRAADYDIDNTALKRIMSCLGKILRRKKV